jgi:hypothetical protein
MPKPTVTPNNHMERMQQELNGMAVAMEQSIHYGDQVIALVLRDGIGLANQHLNTKDAAKAIFGNLTDLNRATIVAQQQVASITGSWMAPPAMGAGPENAASRLEDFARRESRHLDDRDIEFAMAAARELRDSHLLMTDLYDTLLQYPPRNTADLTLRARAESHLGHPLLRPGDRVWVEHRTGEPGQSDLCGAGVVLSRERGEIQIRMDDRPTCEFHIPAHNAQRWGDHFIRPAGPNGTFLAPISVIVDSAPRLTIEGATLLAAMSDRDLGLVMGSGCIADETMRLLADHASPAQPLAHLGVAHTEMYGVCDLHQVLDWVAHNRPAVDPLCEVPGRQWRIAQWHAPDQAHLEYRRDASEAWTRTDLKGTPGVSQIEAMLVNLAAKRIQDVINLHHQKQQPHQRAAHHHHISR